MKLYQHQKMLTAEEQMMRILMPLTSANDPEPLAIFVNRRSTASKTLTFKLCDALHRVIH